MRPISRPRGSCIFSSRFEGGDRPVHVDSRRFSPARRAEQLADPIFNGYSPPQNALVQEICVTPTGQNIERHLRCQEPIMMDTELHLREAIIAKCRWMNATGLNQGTSGNISARCGETMLISPSATPYDTLTPDMIAAMPMDGDYGSWKGPLKPSTEWRFHLDIMKARPDVGGIVHTHA